MLDKYNVTDVLTELNSDLIRQIRASIPSKDHPNPSFLIPALDRYKISVVPTDSDFREPDEIRMKNMKDEL